MPRLLFLAMIGLLATPPAGARTALGQYGRWGAFREAPGHCYAAAEPLKNGDGDDAPYFAIVLNRGSGPPRLHVVPSRPADGALQLEIGDRVFVLAGAGGRDARDDARIIAAIRDADRLRVTGTDARGRRFHDDYALAGAPSAIDMAIVGCL